MTTLTSRHLLAHIREGGTLEDLIARRHPCALRLSWRDLQAIEAALEADAQKAKVTA